MRYFYAPVLKVCRTSLRQESQHCVRVLRMGEGDEIGIVDGGGNKYLAEIVLAHPKRCGIRILKKSKVPNPWRAQVHVAIAPTKNLDRMEWFAEKVTEIGIDSIALLKCRFSERKELKLDRLNKILISAMKAILKGCFAPIVRNGSLFGLCRPSFRWTEIHCSLLCRGRAERTLRGI